MERVIIYEGAKKKQNGGAAISHLDSKICFSQTVCLPNIIAILMLHVFSENAEDIEHLRK